MFPASQTYQGVPAYQEQEFNCSAFTHNYQRDANLWSTYIVPPEVSFQPYSPQTAYQQQVCTPPVFLPGHPFQQPAQSSQQLGISNPSLVFYEQLANSSSIESSAFLQHSTPKSEGPVYQNPLQLKENPLEIFPKTEEGRWSCQICRKVFDRRARALACMDKHVGMKLYACMGKCVNTECTATFASAEALSGHVKGCERIACIWCGMLVSKRNISRHQKKCGDMMHATAHGPAIDQ